MRIVFTEDDASVHLRAKYLRGALIRNYHNVKVLKNCTSLPDADIWFHGLSHREDLPIPERTIQYLSDFKGKIVFFQNDDDLDFKFHKIPDHLIKKTALFLRNIWPAEISKINAEIPPEKIGLINPFLKPNKPVAGYDLEKRVYPISFFGGPAGENLGNSPYSRVQALIKLKDAGCKVEGGIYPNQSMSVVIPEKFVITQLPEKEYFNKLLNTRCSLVLHGNNPLTFRLFESLSKRCFTLVQNLSEIVFTDCGLKDGIHYISVRKDLSDLVDKINYYEKHRNEAQLIANNGFRFFKQHLAFSGVNLTQSIYKAMIATWHNQIEFSGRKNPISICRKMVLPCIKSL
jgi:hypothetical protein